MRTLIAYDGSAEGQGLLVAIPALFPASTARVLTIYEGPLEMEMSLASAGGVGYLGLDDEAWESFERTSREDGLATAQEASAALVAAGLTADAAAERSRAGASTVAWILETADERGRRRHRGRHPRPRRRQARAARIHVDGTPAPRRTAGARRATRRGAG